MGTTSTAGARGMRCRDGTARRCVGGGVAGRRAAAAASWCVGTKVGRRRGGLSRSTTSGGTGRECKPAAELGLDSLSRVGRSEAGIGRTSYGIQEEHKSGRGCRCAAVLGEAGYRKNLGYSPISIGVSAVALVLSGVSNRVAHKVASVVFAEYILFLSLMLIVAYVFAYFTTLLVRMKKGIVTKRMLEYPKWKFGALGVVDAVALVMQLSAAVHLPGSIIPVLAQVNIPFTLLVSRVVVKRRFSFLQLLGSSLVVAGVLLSLKPYLSNTLLSGAGRSLEGSALLYSSSYLFAALAAVSKESILHNTDYGENGMDPFVISAFGSLSQGFVVLLMLLVASVAYGNNLPVGVESTPLMYVQKGIECFKMNPLPPLCYLLCNILFNVNVVNLVKKSNAVLTTLSIAFVVPLTFIAFSFPIPMLQPVPFYTEALKGLFVLSGGILMYNTTSPRRR